MDERDQLSIGELAERAGLPPSTLRYYERIGLLPEPERASGRRRYDESILVRLRLLRLATRAGFTLTEVGELLELASAPPSAGARWRELAERKLAELDERIARAQDGKRLLQRALGSPCDGGP